MDNWFTNGSAFNAITNAFHDFIVLTQWGHCQGTKGMAIVLSNDDILSHVHQTTGQVTRICCLQCCVSQTFTRTVGRDEVLQDAQSFLKVGEDWVFNDILTSRR